MVDLTPFKTLAEVIALVVVFYTYFSKVVRFTDKQQKLEKDVEKLRAETKEELKAIKAEQQVLTYGVLACLKGLKEKGCNGPVTDAITTIEKYLNASAHK